MTSSELKQAAKFALKDNFIAKMLLFIVPLLISILTRPFIQFILNDHTT